MSSEIPSSVLHGSTNEPFYVIDWKSANLKCRLFAEKQPENEALESSLQNVIYDLKCDGLVSGAGPIVNGTANDPLRRRIVREWVDEQGRLHHPGGKAARETDDGQLEFWEHGVRHRAGGLPAVEIPKYGIEFWESGIHKRSIMTNGTQMWFNEAGDLHRDDAGPAIVYGDGRREWWRDGVKYREDPIEDVLSSHLDSTKINGEASSQHHPNPNPNPHPHRHHQGRRRAPPKSKQGLPLFPPPPPPPEHDPPAEPQIVEKEEKETGPSGLYFSTVSSSPPPPPSTSSTEQLEAQIEKTIDDLSVMLQEHRVEEERREKLERTRTELLGKECLARAKSVLPLRPDLVLETVEPEEKLSDSQRHRLVQREKCALLLPSSNESSKKLKPKGRKSGFGCFSCGTKHRQDFLGHGHAVPTEPPISDGP